MTLIRPKHIPLKYDKFIFVKFYNEIKWVTELRKGNLFMRSKEYFAKIEQKGMKDETEIFDFFVKSTENLDFQMELKSIEDNSFIIFHEKNKTDDDVHFFAKFDDVNRYSKIFCLYTLWYDSASGDIFLPSETMREDFGEYCCLIYDVSKFWNAIIKYTELNQVNNYDYGFVEYIDCDKEVFHYWSPFKKPMKEFSYQNEFRIILNTMEKTDSFIFQTDDVSLSESSFQLTFDALINNTKIMNNKISTLILTSANT